MAAIETRPTDDLDTIIARANREHPDRGIHPHVAQDGSLPGFANAMAHQFEVSKFLADEAESFEEFVTHFVTEREASAFCDAAVGEF